MKNNTLRIFQHDQFGTLRAVMMDGRPWFVAKDVTKCLDYQRSSSTIHSLVPAEEKTVIALDTGRGTTRTSVITARGVLCLADRSIMPGAEEFARWVRTEVLPALQGGGAQEAPLHEKAGPAGKKPAQDSPADDGAGISGGLLIIIVEED
ncbi:MAG: Bro-N domain-containing protein [Oscillospiraceae bacterium]|nr:Bro-N domain-containing protein [Oscillospiraceae bacterium]